MVVGHPSTRHPEIREQPEIKEVFKMVTDTSIDAGGEIESSEENSGVIYENLRWRCTRCEDTIEGTDKSYINFCKNHPKKNKCKVVLIDGVSGEVLAKDLRDAQEKGIFKKKTSSSKDDTDPGSPSVPRDGQPLFTGYFKTEKVELNGKLWLFRDIFIQEKLIPADTKMGDFLLGAVETLLEMTGRRIGIIETKKREGE